MFLLLTFLSLISCGHSILFNINTLCEFNQINSCLNNYYCSWCNVSYITNGTYVYEEKCKIADVCENNFNSSSLCLYNKHYESVCDFYSLLINVLILFVLFGSTYSILYSIITSLSEENTSKKIPYSIIIGFLINIPAIILWFTRSQYFILYIFSLIIISFLLCITGGTKKYIQYKNEKKHEFTPLVTYIH
jgi:hypothetical protein